MKTLVTLDATRSIQTPAAGMHTYASPTSEVRADLAVWRTEMAPGVSGPLHEVDTDHVVVVVSGTLTAEVDGEDALVAAGDCVVLPAHAPRRITAGPDGVTTLTAALPGSTARAADAAPVTVPWAN